MTFGKALVALKAGKTITRPDLHPIRMPEHGGYERKFGVGWVPLSQLWLGDIVKDDWEVAS